MRPRSSRAFDFAGSLALVGTAITFIAVPVIIKYLTGHLDTWTQNAFRYLTAFVIWTPFLVFRMRQGRVNMGVWRKALVPTLLNVVQQIFFTTAFYYIEPAFMTLLVKTALIWIIVFAFLLFPDERRLLRSKIFWSGLPLCIIGVIGVMVFKEGFTLKGTVVGILLTLACGFSWGVYTVSVRYFFRDIDSRTGFAVIAVYTTVALVVLALIFGNPLEGLSMPPEAWAAVIASGLLGIAFGHVLYFVAIRRIGATISALFLLVTPLGVYAVTSFLFGEILGLKQWVFGVVLLSGAALVLWSQKILQQAPRSRRP
jgi:drug/metabolite transporter (DMT)-like permease